MPLVSYLKNGIIPDGKDAARKLKVQAMRFVLIKDVFVQKGLLPPVAKVLRSRGSKIRHERGSQGDLRKPFGGTISSAQADSNRILLANHAQGHTSLCQNM